MPQPITEAQRKQLKKLGEKIKSIRLAKEFTMEQVAHKVGKDKQSIDRLEKGNVNPSYIYLTEVCKGLGIDIKDLF